MKTYYIFIRNANTHYMWYCVGTARHYKDSEMQNEIWAMQERATETEFKYEKMEE